MKSSCRKSENRAKGSRSNKIRKDRQYKKKFVGNYRTYTHQAEKETSATSASTKKLFETDDFIVEPKAGLEYVIISFVCVFSTLSNFVKCKECDGDISFSKGYESGLGFQLVLTCSCRTEKIYSCKMIHRAYEVNRKFVFAMRLLGVGFYGFELFCAMMDMKTMCCRTYYNIVNNLKIATQGVLETVIKKAGKEEKEQTKQRDLPEDELAVSGDGTWARRGFSALVGVTSVIGKYTGKVLDIFVSSKMCQSCENAKKRMTPTEYLLWFEAEHSEDCASNYEGSSGGMEVQGVLEMFKRSITLHAAKYAYYIGDGDSKTFSNLVDSNPYTDFIVKKLECVLHVGKRMFRRLKEAKKTLTEARKIKKKQEEKIKKEQEEKEKESKKKAAEPPKKRRKKGDPPVEKPVKTADLTGKTMKEMSLFYSLAIQNNPDSIEKMKRDILAGYYHRISTNENPLHQYCSEDWCKFLQYKREGKSFNHKPALSQEVQDVVLPVFTSLTDDELLSRCLGGNTQNNNESLNAMIWCLAPKHLWHGKSTVEIASWISVSVFNEGSATLLKMLDVMDVDTGPIARKFVSQRDKTRIKRAERSSSEQSKEARIAKKKDVQAAEEAYEQAYGLLYGPGMAD